MQIKGDDVERNDIEASINAAYAEKSRRPFFRFPARCAAVWAAGI